jgi:antitoxin (DNA-binding transcriptional repressor) of toxin-antitoxin stability system
MSPVNMLEAKTTLSRLVEAVATGAPRPRSSSPATAVPPPAWCPSCPHASAAVTSATEAALLAVVPIAPARKRRQGGLANGLFTVPEDFDAYNDEILAMFDASE